MARTTKTPPKTAGTAKRPTAAKQKASAAAADPDKTRRADPAGARAVTPGSPPAPGAKAADAPKPVASPSPEAATTGTARPAPQTAASSSVPAVAKQSADPKPSATPEPARASSEPSQRGSGFLPLLLGGVLAGAIGFVVAAFLLPQPDTAPMDTSRLDALASEIDALKAADAPEVDLSGLQAGQDDLSARIDTLATRIDDIEANAAPANGSEPSPALSELRDRVDGLATDIAALRDDLTDRVTAVEDGLAESNALADSVESEAEALAQEAARNQVRMALQSGAAYAEPLSVLGGDAPEALAAPADTGVATQTALTTSFPELSREALREARAETAPAGVGSLFQNAFNPRSLQPREGDDPDAVLSRAEAAVRDGDLDAALAEIEALPDGARAILEDWTNRARARAEALAAANDYLQDG